MPKTVVITGTGTEVGKTFVAAALIAELRRRGVEMHPRKPVQSFEPGTRPDAEILAEAAGITANEVCPEGRSYEVPLAPPMAAEALRRAPLAIADLVAEIDIPSSGITLIEGAGGVRSPLADDGDIVDLIDGVGADAIVLVADAELGTLNAVFLSVEALAGRNVFVYLNRYDASVDVHERNLRWLEEAGGLDVAVDVDGLATRLTQEDG